MNRRLLLPLVTFYVLLGAAAAPALGQYGTSPAYGPYYNPYSLPPGVNPGGTPRLSPYLNLFRGNTNPAVNYYLGVVPEIQNRRFENRTRQAISALAGGAANPAVNPEDLELTPTVSITGHPTAFFNTTGYFGTAGPAPLPSRSVPMSPAPPAKPGAGAGTRPGTPK